MALSDPQSIKISGVTTSLPRTSTGDHTSTYEAADGNTVLKLSTVENRRNRQTVRVDLTKITADPFIPAQNTEVSMSMYLVIDRPLVGYTNAEALAGLVGFIESITSTENTILKKLLARES